MSALPDRVSIDLRRREQQEHEAALEYKADQPARMYEAVAATRNTEQLRAVLNDEELAAPLSELMQHFDALGYEIGKLQSDHRVPEEALGAIKASARALAQIERLLVAFQLGEY